MQRSKLLPFAFVPLTSLLLAVAPAVAEPMEEKGPRQGGTFGISIGAGHIACEDSDGNDCSGEGNLPAGSLALHAGVMLGSASSLSVELWGMRHSDDGATVNQGILAGAFRGWLAPRLWAQGGLGVARVTSEFKTGLGTFTSQSDVVPAGVIGVGVEVLSSPAFALDLELKGGAGLYRDDIRVYNASLGVGVSFY